MALAKSITAPAENKGHTRRNFLSAALAIGAATPAVAFVGPAPEIPEAPAMPDWWKRLTRREQIERHAEAILRLVEQDAPESELGVSCRLLRGADGAARFEAQTRDGSMAMLNPQTMAWV